MITAYATLKKAAANANYSGKRLDEPAHKLIVQVCDEILAGQHHDMFPLHVWMTGSGTQFNMNVNEVISNRCCQLSGTPLGSKKPVHPNDHVNMSQSSNDSFPSAMYIAAAVNVTQRLIPAVKALHDATEAKSWNGPISSRSAEPTCKMRHHYTGAGMVSCAGMLTDDLERIGDAQRDLSVSPRRHRSRHQDQCRARFCRGSRCPNCQADGSALCQRTEQIHRAGRA